MNAIKSHKDLLAWQRAIALACKVYAATRLLPREERFDLDRQLRRSAISVATRIAEGNACRERAESLRCLRTARGALLEVETQTMIAIGQGYLDPTSELPDDIAEVGRLINKLLREISAANQLAHARACAPDQMVRQTSRNTSHP